MVAAASVGDRTAILRGSKGNEKTPRTVRGVGEEKGDTREGGKGRGGGGGEEDEEEKAATKAPLEVGQV